MRRPESKEGMDMEKKRFIALTDIHRLPDDKQSEIDDVESMCRLLLYANDIDLEGLIATSSFCYRNGGEEKDRKIILDIIDAYEKVKPNLDVHAKGYPDADDLRSVTFCGIPEYGKKYGQGFGDEKYNDNPGVNHIIHVVDKDDERPVWIGLWGGCNTLAQAVFKVWKTRTKEELSRFLSKLRIYGISDQDKGGIWLRENFGERLFYIVSPTSGTTPGAIGFKSATWQGMSFDYFMNKNGRKEFAGARSDMITKEWISQNICGETAYRKLYPAPTLCMEGDTPSYLGLIPNGLGDMEHPDWGGWGGRYEFYLPQKVPIFGKKERYPIWTNANDTVPDGRGGFVTGNHATIWRWREAVQNDFLARLRWTEVSEFEKAVHAPVVRLATPSVSEAKAGARVTMSAKGTYDPNGLPLKYHWFYYKEAGNYAGTIWIDDCDKEEASLVVPDRACTLHVVLEVTNEGTPEVTRYARVILNVK